MADEAKIKEYAKNVSDELNCDIFFYSGPIDSDGYDCLASSVVEAKVKDNCLLLLTTAGGQANPAYRIARFLQKMYAEVILHPPSYCMSAGTLVALGAHRLIMSPFSELGPLDVQLLKIDDIGGQKSGLLSQSSFDSLGAASFGLFEQFMLGIKRRSQGLISFKLASQVGSEVVSNLMAPVYGQVSPDVVGSDYRDLQVATEYGLRLVRTSRNASRQSIQRLVHEYPSHDFIIDEDEAREIFRRVEAPSSALNSLVAELGQYAFHEAPTAMVLPLTHSGLNKEELEDTPTPPPERMSEADLNAAGDGNETNVPADVPEEAGAEVKAA